MFNEDKTLHAVYEKLEKETLFSGRKQVNIGDEFYMYNSSSDLSINIPNQVGADTSLYSAYEITFQLTLYCYDEPGLAAGVEKAAFAEGDSCDIIHGVFQEVGNWATVTHKPGGKIYLKFTDAYKGYYGWITIYEVVGIFKHQINGEFVATASYDFGAFGLAEECYAEIQINFAVENGVLIESEHSFDLNFDFEEYMGCTYEEYVEDYMTVSDLVQNENTFSLTLTDSQGDADGDVVITYDDTSDTWSVENNIGCAIGSNFKQIS